MKSYDLIVIGAGPGGTPAAMAAAQFGKSVLLVDKRGKLGGECLFEGCIPSKVLENAANRYKMFKEASKFHVQMLDNPQIHWEEVLKEKEALLQKRSLGAEMKMKLLPSLTFKKGKACFADTHVVEIDGERFGFKHAIIATGALVNIPSFKGSGVDKAWTNKDLFNYTEIPNEIVFVGAGAISCELVQMFNKLGTKCHILERGKRILGKVDEECTTKLYKKMLDDGITIDLNVNIESIEDENGNFIIHFNQNGNTKMIQTPHVLLATGRFGNVEGLGLDIVNVAHNEHGIITDKTLQTSQAHIYAVGDCNIGPKFAHWATYEAGIAIHNIYAPHKREIDIDKLCWVLFSDPQIASVGLDEAEAKKRDINVTVQRYDYAVDARAQIDKEILGLLKFVIDKKSSVIIGIQILGEDASSLSGEASLIVSQKMTVMDIMGAIHPHPTLSEAFGVLAKNTFFKSMLMAKKKKL